MEIEILADGEAVASRAAEAIARSAAAAVAARGRFSLAVSGGHTPWRMLRLLADAALPWEKIDLFQVDERIAPAGDPDRNWTHVGESLLAHARIPLERLHPMPVEATDPDEAARAYAAELGRVCGGDPPVLDLVHLGLGPDGHTASLVPGDPAREVRDRAVALTGVYVGRRRMTLTFPVLDAAREILWVVTGAEKVPVLPRLERGDRGIPAGCVSPERARILADRAAAGGRAG